MIATEYELRPCKLEDKPFLYHLLQATLRPYVEQIGYWDEQSQRDQFEMRFSAERTQIIQVDGQDVGCIIVEVRPQDWYIAEIQILPVYQGQGIGTSILRQIMEQAASQEMPLTLQVLRNNPARRLYERLGFQRTGQSLWHYHFRWQGH